MATAFATGIAAGTDGAETASEAATAASDDLDASPDFCQVFASPALEYEAVLEGVRSVIGTDAELIGCAGTGLFTDERSVESGVALGLVASDTAQFQSGLGTGLGESTRAAIREARRGIAEPQEGLPHRSALALFDSLNSDGEELAQRLRRKFGARVPFAGGAASDGYQLDSTPVFWHDQVVEDALAIAIVDTDSPTHIVDGHGHEPIADPMEVTAAEGQTLLELDGRPAYEVWRETVRTRARELLELDVDAIQADDDELLQLLGVFEFGIDQGESYKLRACIRADPEAGTMQPLVAIPEGTHVQIMGGTVDSQIESARRAARRAHDRADGSYAGGFVYDCACRHVILGEAFEQARTAMREELAAPFVGFETYGELSMHFDRTSGFHNTTTVISLFPS